MKKWISIILMAVVLMLGSTALAEPLTVEMLENVDQAPFSMMFQLTIDAQGNQAALTTQEPLSNFMVEHGSMDDELVNFVPDYTVFSAKEFCPDQLVVINTYFGDTLPTLRVSYTLDDQVYSYYMSQSGNDLSLLLISTDEFI